MKRRQNVDEPQTPLDRFLADLRIRDEEVGFRPTIRARPGDRFPVPIAGEKEDP